MNVYAVWIRIEHIDENADHRLSMGLPDVSIDDTPSGKSRSPGPIHSTNPNISKSLEL